MTACVNRNARMLSRNYPSVQIAIIDGWTIKGKEAHKVDLYGCHLMGVIEYGDDGVEIIYVGFYAL